MTISHLFDHVCVIWRKLETLGDYRETVKRFELQYTGLGCKANRKNVVLMQDGAGIIDVGMRVIYLEPGPVILKRDLLELISGPDSPALLEVENVTLPRGHHLEVRCSDYKGAPPELGS